MKTLKEYLLFDRLVAPIILKILFWPALAACIFYSAGLVVAGNPIGWVPLIVGSLFVRVAFEGLILFFSIYEKLSEMNENLKKP